MGRRITRALPAWKSIDIAVADEKGVAVNYGWAVLASSRDQDLWANILVDEDKVIEFLHQSAADSLPPNTRYEIRKRIPSNFGMSFGIAWFRAKEFDDAGEWCGAPQPIELAYFCVGRFVTPA